MDIKVTDKGIRYYAGSVEPARGVVFVFGSNPEGRHGLGAARVAKDRFGARYGVGEGLVGNSYALPTKDLRVTANRGLRSIAPEAITESVKRMYGTARQNPDRLFCIAYRNTDDASLNGYTGHEMMDMFNAAGPVPGNVVFSQEWALSGHLDVSLFQAAVPVKESPEKGVSVAIVGGRDFEDYSLVENTLSQLMVRYDITKVVSGGARGADSLAERWADAHGISKQVFPADWDRYGRSAGFRRNKDIVANADMVVAFWDGQSRGTKNTLDLTRDAGKPLFVVGYGPNKGNDVGFDELKKAPFKDRRLNVLDDIAFEITYGGDRFSRDDIWFIMGEVTRDEIMRFRQRVFDRAMNLYPDQGKDFVQKGVDYWFPMEFAVSHKRNEGWGRLSPNGYECSTRGDKRFSAMVASFNEGTYLFGQDVGGMTIEDVYQKVIKRSGKGQPPAPDSPLFRLDLPKKEREDFMYQEGYLPLWTMWAEQNDPLIRELRQKADGRVLTDMFASTRVSQARALDDILCGRLRYFSEAVERHFEKLNARKDSLDRRLAFPRDTELVFLENGSWVRHGVSGMTVGEVYADLVMKAKEGEGPSRESELWLDERQLTEEGVKVLPSYYFEMAYKPLVYYWACLNGGAASLSELSIPDDELAPNGRCLSKALEDMKNEVGLNALRIVHLDGLDQRQTPLEILSYADRPKELKADFKVHL